MIGTVRWPSLASPTSVQSQLGSRWQSAEQPSPEVVLPSSHSSSGSLRPSPHGEVQPMVPWHTGSDRQSAVQPSPPITLPSSQDSLPSLIASPQTVGWHSVFGVGQANPGSTRQMSLQPSPGVMLPSSQVSRPRSMPSPHTGRQRAPPAGQVQPGSSWQIGGAAVARRQVAIVAALGAAIRCRRRSSPSRRTGCPARRRSSRSRSGTSPSSRRRRSDCRRRRSRPAD